MLAVGAAVRIWGIGFGLPLSRAHPDEPLVAHTAVQIAGGSFDPGFFNYPTLFMYVSGGAYRAYCAASTAAGRSDTTADCLASWPVRWEPFFIMTRALSALAGTLTIWLVFRLAARLFDEATGLVAASLLSVAFLHVRDSHFGVTDVFMVMLVVASVLALVRAHDRPTPAGFALAGLLAGLAASTKYNALLLAVAVLASQWRALRDGGRIDARVPVFGLSMLAGFVAGTPYALIDRAQFWRDATSEAVHLQAGHGIRLAIGWKHHLLVSLWHGLSWPLLFAAVAGACWMLLRARRRGVLLLAFPVVYYAVAGRGYTVFARYMVPMVPFLCVTAAYFVMALARLAVRRHGRVRLEGIATVLTFAIALPSAVQAMRYDGLLARTDSRVLAAEWIATNIPAGSSLHLAGGQYGSPDVSRRGAPPVHTIWEFDERRGLFDTPRGLTTDWPDWIVIQESPLSDYSRVPAAIRERLGGYELRQAFQAVDMRRPHVYDQQDAFFLPLAGFAGVGRPGPNIYIYRKR